jgi:iron(III) transport system ATP-binding protein
MNVRSQEAFLSLDGLTVLRGDHTTVDGVDLAIEEHTFLVLVGPSGCGKTSLLRAIAGFEPPAGGTIRLAGRMMAGGGAWMAPEKREVGMVFQDGALFPHLTVRGNVSYGVGSDRARRVDEVLELVGLRALEARYPDELSGGERQRAALARALAPSPRLLLLDEPFASLDAGLRQRVRTEVLEILAETRTTSILVTHDQEEALSVGDRVAVMIEGRVLQEDSPAEIYRRPSSLEVARFVGDGQMLACRIEGGRAKFSLGETPAQLEDGEGWVLVRPEQIRLAEEGTTGVSGRIQQLHFYGHDLLEVVVLDSGERFDIRLPAGKEGEVGQRVCVALAEGDYPVYPAR